ncbi:MAG: long-chain fatty acid--CoA ligase [Actinomycetota bacterium]|nr:long-chain fatty acid--CoA ligase [Actinomycetota bacterium]
MTLPGLMQPAQLTIGSIFDRMRTIYPEGEVVSPEGRITYGAIADRILRLCSVLTERFGIHPGDRVATFGFNSSRHFELYYAVPLVGAVLHTVNVRLFPEQIEYVMNHAEDRVVFFDGDLAPNIEEIAPRLKTVDAFVGMGAATASGLSPLFDHDELIAATQPAPSLPNVPENAACGLCYTSGTTGMPKGVLSSHRGMWLHSLAQCTADCLGLREADRVFPIVPMFHAFAWGLPYSAPFTGAELIFHGSDTTSPNVGRLLQDERVTVTAAVPTIWKELLPHLQSGEFDISSVRGIYIGGSAVPQPLIEAYHALGSKIVQLWGMTETGPLACVSYPRRPHTSLDEKGLFELRAKTGTIMPGVELRIAAPDGKIMPWDGKSVGEIEVRGPWIAGAYYNDDSSDEKFHDGWLRTGDMAYVEPEAVFKIVDRAKDLVKSGGEWISSVELEGALLGHPKIRDAAVVGIKSAKWDERPVAVIVPRGEAPTLESIREFLAPNFAKWWLPDDVVVVDEIPKTSVGKLDKKVLRAKLGDLELP